MLQNIALSFQGLWSHKLRSFLTMLGIIIGIASIITIVSTIKGTSEQIKENLIGAGNNVVTVRLSQDGNPMELSYMALPAGVSPADEEARAAVDALPGVKECSLYRSRSYAGNIFWKNNAFSGDLYGVDSHFFSVNGYQVRLGRGFTERDFTEYRKTAILNARAASRLFEGENPVGMILEIQGEPYTVVGVAEKDVTNSPTIETMQDYYLYADTSSGIVFVPDNAWNVLFRYDEPQSAAVRAESTDDMTKAGRAAADLLNEKTVSGGNVKYEAVNLLERASELENLAGSANTQLVWIAGISLLVGGIGVMNIMMVSVTERTREIGLKKALGARRRRILWQFLTEAAVLTSLGGILGVAGGIGLAKMLSHVMSIPTAVSVPACLVAVAFSTVIGLFFGLVPAIKASKLNPIEALRRE